MLLPRACVSFVSRVCKTSLEARAGGHGIGEPGGGAGPLSSDGVVWACYWAWPSSIDRAPTIADLVVMVINSSVGPYCDQKKSSDGPSPRRLLASLAGF